MRVGLGGKGAGSDGERTGAVCALRRPSLAHTSYFQLVIVATAAAPPCCFFSCRASTWQPILKLLLAGLCSALRMCIPQLKRNVFLTSFDHRFHDFFFFLKKFSLNENPTDYSPQKKQCLLSSCSIYGFPTQNSGMQSVQFLWAQTTSITQLVL